MNLNEENGGVGGAGDPPSRADRWLAGLLSVCLGLFLADAAVSLLHTALECFFGGPGLPFIHGAIAFLTFLMVAGVYLLMGLTPKVPKRVVLPLALFYVGWVLVLLPFAVFYHGSKQVQLFEMAVCAVQLAVGLVLLRQAQGGFRLSWPLVVASGPEVRWFSWKNLAIFGMSNLLVPPLVAAGYLFLGASLLVTHFTGGFLSLHPSGLQAQVRKYIRADGKTIELIPMVHVADAQFYEQVAESFPSNSVILMEGVTDEKKLLTDKLNYSRLAKDLGLAEQKKVFVPANGELVPADVDVSDFSPETIRFVNLATLIHAGGFDQDAMQLMVKEEVKPGVEKRILKDILTKRNEHLFGEIQARLPETETIMVPWGAAHMPGIEAAIRGDGFKLVETHEYKVIRF